MKPHNVSIYYHWSDGPSRPFFSHKPHLSLISNRPGFPQVTLLTFATLGNSQKMDMIEQTYCLANQTFDTEGLFDEQCLACGAPSCLFLAF